MPDNPIDVAVEVRNRTQRVCVALCTTRLTTAGLLLRLAGGSTNPAMRARRLAQATGIAAAVDRLLDSRGTESVSVGDLLALRVRRDAVHEAIAGLAGGGAD